MRSALPLLLLSACTAGPMAPNVRIVSDEPLSDYVAGASAWNAVGFYATTDDDGLPECDRQWYLERTESRECQITIGIVRTGTIVGANRAARTIYIDPIVVDRFQLLIAVAHETGHIVLDTPRHTDGGVMGGATYVLDEVDYELACETIGC